MKFYDATTKQGICQKIDFLCDTNDTAYPRLQKTREVNVAGETIVNIIIQINGMWQFDDLNYTDLPVGTGDLVAGQSVYSFADRFLTLKNVKIKDAGGNWVILTPIDQSETSKSLEDYLTTDAQPLYYDKIGDTIKLYPAPSADSVYAGGSNIKIETQRKFKPFTATSGTTNDTTEPGFDVEHDVLAYMASIPYCLKNKKDRVPAYLEIIKEKIKIIKKSYSSKQKDVRKKATTRAINFR